MRELPLLTVLAVVATGLAVAWAGGWRTGSLLVGAALLLAAVLRLALPQQRIGLLAVRTRRLDVVVLLVLGALLAALAVTVPPPEGG